MRVFGYGDAGPDAVVSGGLSDEMDSSVGAFGRSANERAAPGLPVSTRDRAFRSGGFYSSWTAAL